jgi:hypothetical protein
MARCISRLVLLLSLVFIALSTSIEALAQSRPFVAQGTAQFTTANDFVGFGHATHLGVYTEVGNVSFTPSQIPGVLDVDGWAHYTAANGDQLYASIHGTLDTTTGQVLATVTYVGGTGRFANATGWSHLDGQMLGGGAISVAVGGTVDY